MLLLQVVELLLVLLVDVHPASKILLRVRMHRRACAVVVGLWTRCGVRVRLSGVPLPLLVIRLLVPA